MSMDNEIETLEQDYYEIIFNNRFTLECLNLLRPNGRSSKRPMDNFKNQLVVETVADDISDANLDTTFGEPATLGEGFIGFYRDSGGTPASWFAVTYGTSWYQEGLSQA